MKDRRKTNEQLLSEVAALRQRVEELESVDAELHKTRSFYQQLVEGSGDAIIAVDTKGTVVTWNAGAERMLGWKADEILGQVHARHQTDETKEAIGKYLRRILAGEFLDNIEMPLRTKDGTFVDVLVTGSPVKDVSGETVAAHVIMKDITERKRTEELLRERKEQLRMLTDQVPGVLWTTDTELRFTSSTGAGLADLGLRPDQVVGMTLFEYFQTDSPDFMPLQVHRRALEGESNRYELHWEGRTFDCHVEPLKGVAGDVLGTIGFALDISELKRAAQELLRAEKLASLGRLTAGACHEILNPLNIIKMRLHVLADDPATPQETVRQIQTMEEQASRIAKITKGLLLYSRQRRPERHPLNLNDIVTLALDLVEHELKLHNIDVKIELTESIPTLAADKDQLHQVVLNLLTNAQDAMPDGGELFISTDVVPEDGRQYVELRVEDSGEGIDPEHREKLFEPFYTTKPEGEGTGLGLSICQGIIEGHGGSIWVESGTPRGAAFVIRLPVDHTG